MTFRNIASLFFIFLSLLSCKGVQYYQSGTNPAAISVILRGPDHFYTNAENKEMVQFYIANHNSGHLAITSWPLNLTLVGKSRFYAKEISFSFVGKFNEKETTIMGSNDTVLIGEISIDQILLAGKNWTYKNKPSFGPHLISARKAYPYIYLIAELKTPVVNQESIKIRSNAIKINVAKYSEPKLVGKKTELSLTSDVQTYSTKQKTGNLVCKITNTGDYPIPLFNDPGAVRFRIFAYGPNRTSIMYTQYILDNGKLPVEPVSIASKGSYTITVPLQQLLYSQRPEDAYIYWTWNKKNPPVSPLVYGKDDIALTTEFWFGVVVDGQEFLSNIINLNIDSPNKKLKKSK